MSMTQFLLPVLALITWTAVMWFWLYITRIPALTAARIHPNKARHPSGDWKAKLPSRVLSITDNYNHLHEQPTLFYALMFFIALTTGGDATSWLIGWTYVGLRVLHSFAQIFASQVVTRFFVFAAASLALFVLLIRTILTLIA